MQAIGFDLDGTLLETLSDIGGACNAVLARHGYPQHPIAAYAQMVGNGFDLLFRRALPADLMPEPCAISEMTAEARQYYADHLLVATKPYPGIPEAVQNLADTGIKLFVLSNKPDPMTVELIRHFFPDIPFVAIRGARPDEMLKPDPSIMLGILAEAGASPQESAYVGDSNVDMQTALNAGVLAVGAAWGFRGPAELMAAGCQLLLQKPTELASLTKRFK